MERIEGIAKLTGAERYVDDLPVEGALWGMTVRSPAPRGRIREVRFDPAVDWSEFVVVDHRDMPGANEVLLIEPDQPVLAADRVRHVHEPVVLLAHPSRDAVRRAVRAVEVVVEPEAPYLDFATPPRPEQVQRGDDNVMKRIEIRKGDVEAGLARAARVVEGVYRTGAQEHVYIETQGMLAWEEDGVLFIKGSLQCPYYVHKAALRALGRDADGVRIVQAPTGGGFGGKEEYPSMIALHAALLALEGGQAGQDRLRPRRGHGGDDEAPPLDRAPPDRSGRRRPARRAGHRRAHGRRRVRDPLPRRPLARRHPRRRARTAATTSGSPGAR